MTKHEQLWQEFCRDRPSGDRPSDGFIDYLIERLLMAEEKRDNWKREYYAAKSLLDEYYN